MEWRWRAPVVLLSVALVTSIAWGYTQYNGRKEAETILSSRYQQAFFDALGQIENVEVLLSKALVATAPAQRVRYLSELWQQAFWAQANLNALPLQQGTLMRTSRFLTQLGDFSFGVGQKLAGGDAVEGSDWDTLQRLHREVTALGTELTQVVEETASGRMPWDEIRRRTNLNLNPFSKRLDPVDSVDGFTRIEQQMQEFPTLVYDGPFSDHTRKREPKGLVGEAVDSFTARTMAQQFVPVGEGAARLTAEQVAETGEGAPIPAWRIEVASDSRGEPLYVLDVAKQGGSVVWMLANRGVDEGRVTLSLAEATEIAKGFLAERGFTSFEVTYPVVEAGRAVIPFVLVEDEVLIYPDQIKVTVALDDGEVVGFDALQYYTSHHDRSLPGPKLRPEEAVAQVREDLDVEDVRLALIPRADLREVLTYEIRARFGSNLYHIYVNAEDGTEEQILRIVESEDQGRMAI